jgi:metal transporter CNNM
MDIFITVVIVAALVLISALCSGLNISLMSLKIDDLRRKARLGNDAAGKILPLRKNTNLSLASILLFNISVVSATSLVLENALNPKGDHAVTGVAAGLMTTLLIVIFGEILPQALFSRHALAYTSRLTRVLWFMIIVTYPVSKPLQFLLDKLLGNEQPVYLQTRHELGLMIAEHLHTTESELDDDEIEIMRGALQLSEKRVRDIMTPIHEVFWFAPDTVITDKLIDEIKLRGRSRMPIFDRALTKCYGVVLMKEMVDVDFDKKLMHIDELPLHPCPIVGSMTALDTIFRRFVDFGTHFIAVEKDDRIIGIVTIEDLIEEIVGREIEDETDRRRSRLRPTKA